MIRRLSVLCISAFAATVVGASPAMAAQCSLVFVADLPPPGPGGGDFVILTGAFTVPAGSVSAVESVFSSISQIPLPAGSTKTVVAGCA